MALTLRIENETNLPDGGPLSIRVSGRRGIDLGRDPHLDWTLPDPSRFISGKHCEVRFQNGDYVIYDVSTNGTFVNGSDRRMQGPHRLRHGDRLLIGNYIVVAEIDASDQAAEPARAPMAPPINTAEFWSVDGAAPPAHRAEVMPNKQNRPVQPDFLDWAMDLPDPVRDRGRGGNDFGDPFAAPVGGAQPGPFDAPMPIPTPARPAGQSPFAVPVGGGSPFDPPPLPRVDPGKAGGASPWDTPAAVPMTGAIPPPLPATPIPPPLPPVAAPVPAVAPLPPVGGEAGAPAGGEFAGGRRSVWVDTRPVAAEEPAPPATQSEFAAVRPSAQAPAAGGMLTAEEALARIAKGAGVQPQALMRRDAGETLEEVGAVLRTVAENMMRLLAARSDAKRMMRSSEHTMIGATDNNPLKFSPTVEEAIMVMLGPPMRSYLSGQKAMAEGFEDLVNHQARTYAAMQQAMRMLFEDLDPAEVEKAVEADKGVAALLGSRKAKLWDHYAARWQAKTLRNDNGMVGAFMLYFSECYDRLGSSGR